MALEPGSRLGPYEVLEPLGGGTMGVVYKARDERLRRLVAIKLLPPNLTKSQSANQRFLREARATSALDHPNICTIYEIDETPDGGLYLVMAYYPGETLKPRLAAGSLPPDEALNIAAQVSRGLATAHDTGVVHRDIKPANVLVTHDGTVKILDFGLAKLAGTEDMTQPGTLLGTVAYMSPEQARGPSVDHRTDIWAVGVLLYEMLSGRRPFPAQTLPALLREIIDGQPPAITQLRAGLPQALDGVIERALAKEPHRRYRSGHELAEAIEAAQRSSAKRVDDPTPTGPPSIAVLPFTDLSADQDQAYLCEGIAEEIINALTRVRGVRVVSRTSSFQLKAQTVDLDDLATRLGVGTVLEGSVRRDGRRLRVTAELASTRDQRQIWSERYDREMGDVFAVQDDIAHAVVRALTPRLLQPIRPLVAADTDNLDAYQLYLRGRYHWFSRSAEGLQQAIRFFERALVSDPQYPRALAGLAQTYAMIATYAFAPPKPSLDKATAAVDRALTIDPDCSEVLAALGLVQMLRYDWSGSEAAFRHALELDPAHAHARGWLGWLLGNVGRDDEALAEAVTATERDPLSPYAFVLAATAAYLTRQFERGISSAERALELDPGSVSGLFMLGANLHGARRRDEAIEVYERAAIATGRAALFVGMLARQYGLAGRREDAEASLRELLDRMHEEYVDPVFLAHAYLGLGAHDQVMTWLEKAFAEQSSLLVTLRAGEAFDPVRSNPRFRALLQRMQLEAVP